MTTKLDLFSIKALFNNPESATVNLDDLELHAGTQQRQKPNTEAMEAYQEAMEAGEAPNFPPLRLVRLVEAVTLEDDCTLEAGALVLADGFTRHGAAEKANLEEFQAEIVNGTLDEAIQFSYVANSMHGSKLDAKDYQALIRKIYLQDPSIKKGDLARGLGCAAKTVSKALGVVEEEYKVKARTMMDSGYSDKEIAQSVTKAEQTIKNWRDAYEEEKNQPDPEPKPINPMKLKFDEVLAMTELDKQINLLEMLQKRVDENRRKLNGEPEPVDTPETPQEAPEEQLTLPETNDTPEAPEGPEDALEDPINDADVVISEGAPKTCWDILDRNKEQAASLANPKASLTRSMRTLIKGGCDEATAKAAFDEAMTELAG